MNKDKQLGVKIILLLRKYNFNTNRKDFLLETMLNMPYSAEEYEELSNLFGRIAHDMQRKYK